jgi:phage terminase large subunit
MGVIAAYLKNEKDYVYGAHYLPHDGKNGMQAEVVESRETILLRLDIKPIQIIPRVPAKNIGIDLTKGKMPSVWIDRENCALGIKGLDNYQRQWNERLGKYEDKPLHNWASDPADAFMQWGQSETSYPQASGPQEPKRIVVPNWRVT